MRSISVPSYAACTSRASPAHTPSGSHGRAPATSIRPLSFQKLDGSWEPENDPKTTTSTLTWTQPPLVRSPLPRARSGIASAVAYPSFSPKCTNCFTQLFPVRPAHCFNNQGHHSVQSLLTVATSSFLLL